MAWEIFERAAARYEEWYETPDGVQASRAEEALLAWLLRRFEGASTALEIGCGTGHFTRWLAARGHRAIGLDRSPAMLAELRRRNSALPAVLGDAHGLPFRDRTVDLAFFVATLEFLDSPEIALAEASRVARRGLVLLLLNRWSRGAVSRRWGADSEGAVLRQAHDFSLADARRLVRQGVGSRVAAIHWRSTLFPPPFEALSAPIPFGDVLGVAIELSE
jgi:ubiquinone/menaquinone biosynthesis C-methylase UbiE